MHQHLHLRSILGNTDIYLIDQLMKDRYKINERLLDAGCGGGRNLTWFINQGFDIYGIDQDAESITKLRSEYPLLPTERWQVASLEKTNFPDQFFNHIICSAVLHFADSKLHFLNMITELIRILVPGGSLFIRMATDIGIEERVIQVAPSKYLLPDGSIRFLLTKKLFAQVMKEYPVKLSEPFKSVNVNDERCMSTILLQKR